MGLYLAGIAALLAASIAVRLTHGRSSEGDLNPVMAGYLAGGPRRAMHAAVAVLRLGGAVGVTRAGSVKRRGAPSQDLDPLSAALYDAIPRSVRVPALQRDPLVRQTLAAIRAELAAHGLVTRPWRRWSLGLLAAGVAILGIATTVGEPSGWLTPAIAAASTATAAGLCRLPRRTPAGTRALGTLRERFPLTEDTDTDTDSDLPAEHASMTVALYGSLEAAGIENLTARPPRRRNRTRGPDLSHSASPDSRWIDLGSSTFCTASMPRPLTLR